MNGCQDITYAKKVLTLVANFTFSVLYLLYRDVPFKLQERAAWGGRESMTKGKEGRSIPNAVTC